MLDTVKNAPVNGLDLAALGEVVEAIEKDHSKAIVGFDIPQFNGTVRIMRSIRLDVSMVRFMSADELARWSQWELLHDWIAIRQAGARVAVEHRPRRADPPGRACRIRLRDHRHQGSGHASRLFRQGDGPAHA